MRLHELLVEHLGNLDFIDKKLIGLLMDKVAKNQLVVDYEYETLSKQMRYGLMTKMLGIGRDSKIEHVKLATNSDVDGLIQKLKTDGGAAVIYIDDQQHALIKASGKLNADLDYVIMGQNARSQPIHKWVADFKKQTLDPAWKDGKTSYANLIHKDTVGAELRVKRAEARKGQVPVPKTTLASDDSKRVSSAYAEHIDTLENQFKHRLTKLKDSRMGNVQTEAELIEFLTKVGYLDKIKFMGVVYKFDDHSVNFGDIRKGNKAGSYSRSYVRYKATSDNDTDMDKWREARRVEMTRLKAEGKTDDEISDLIYSKGWKQKKMAELGVRPGAFKVYFTIEGGVIKPGEAELDFGYF